MIGDNDMDLGDDHDLVLAGTAVNGNHIGQKIREKLMKETFVMGITTNSLPYNSTSSPSILCNCFPLIEEIFSPPTSVFTDLWMKVLMLMHVVSIIIQPIFNRWVYLGKSFSKRSHLAKS